MNEKRWSFSLSMDKSDSEERPEDTSYVILVDDGEDLWTIKRKYKDFKLLHFQVRADKPQVKISLPSARAENIKTTEEKEVRSMLNNEPCIDTSKSCSSSSSL